MKKNNPSDRRRYTRLDHLIPVEFQFCDSNQKLGDSKWYHAFSQDIGQGGLRLTVNHLSEAEVLLLNDKTVLLSLLVHIPVGEKEIHATAHAVWFQELKKEPFRQVAIGISYESIHPKDRQRLLQYVYFRRLIKTLAVVFTIFLGVVVVGTGFLDVRLRFENEQLLKNLSSNFQHTDLLEKNRDSLKLQMDSLQFLLSQSDRKIERLQKQLVLVRADDHASTLRLKETLVFLRKNQEAFKTDLSKLKEEKNLADNNVMVQRKEMSLLENKILDKLYHWLSVHQNRLTGLISSYEGAAAVEDWAFTYDQALAVIAFVHARDFSAASKILDFYLSAQKIDNGAVANAYYASNGEIAECVAHAGPNIWLALAMAHYMDKTKDMRYLSFVEGLARWLFSYQDADGGLKGGPTIAWYSTEHNLDAYAFYKMLAKLTQDQSYEQRAQQTLSWLNKNAFSRLGAPLIKRGKGDATIATDTYAWSITAIGPSMLAAQGMNPDEIMEFAINHCSVSVDYTKMDGAKARIKGFDFAKSEHMARGGVISCEWTAQMILAMKIMAQAHQQEGREDKALAYSRLAEAYISDLSKMIITSPSPVGQGDFCLPYASHESADTGHGWRTPEGRKTGSVAATTYAILAMRGINPLRLE
jgi:hypothetical protein